MTTDLFTCGACKVPVYVDGQDDEGYDVWRHQWQQGPEPCEYITVVPPPARYFPALAAQQINAGTWFVAVYRTGQSYGGPEEGGWWFTHGDLVEAWAVPSETHAEILQEHLRQTYPRARNPYSVRPDEDFQVQRQQGMPAPYFPMNRPHYC